MLKSDRVEKYRAWLEEAKKWIEANEHVNKDIAYMCARIERNEGLDKPQSKVVGKVALEVIKALPVAPEHKPEVLQPEAPKEESKPSLGKRIKRFFKKGL